MFCKYNVKPHFQPVGCTHIEIAGHQYLIVPVYSIYLHIRSSSPLFVYYPSSHPSIHPSIIHPSIHPFIHPSLHLSIFSSSHSSSIYMPIPAPPHPFIFFLSFPLSFFLSFLSLPSSFLSFFFFLTPSLSPYFPKKVQRTERIPWLLPPSYPPVSMCYGLRRQKETESALKACRG